MRTEEGESVFVRLSTRVAQTRRVLALSAPQTGSGEVGRTAAANLEA